jgi:hypothetical protein
LDFEEFLCLSVMTLATAGLNGEPHAADVYFAADDAMNLYFFSDPLSQHSLDIARNPRAAATIHPDCSDWKEIRGLQLRGRVKAVDEPDEWKRAWGLYSEKFPFVLELASAVSQNQLFVFESEWIRLVDNRKCFGYKREWDLTTGELAKAGDEDG